MLARYPKDVFMKIKLTAWGDGLWANLVQVDVCQARADAGQLEQLLLQVLLDSPDSALLRHDRIFRRLNGEMSGVPHGGVRTREW